MFIQRPVYAPDANSVAVKGGDTRSHILMLNPKIPGWQEESGSEHRNGWGELSHFCRRFVLNSRRAARLQMRAARRTG